MWEENAGGASSTLRPYLDEILAACASRLGAAQYRVKRQGAAATAAAAKAARRLSSRCDGDAARPYWRSCPAASGTGRQVVPGAVADVLEACPECVVGAGARDEVVRALVAEAGRKKAAYREAAIKALRRALAALAPPREDASRDREPKTTPSRATPTSSRRSCPCSASSSSRSPTRRATRRVNAGSTGGNTVAEMEAEAARVAAEAKTDDAVAILGLRCSATLCAGATRDAIQSAAPGCASLAADALAPAHGWTRARRRARWWPRRRRASPSLIGTEAPSSAESLAAEAWLAPLAAPLAACASDARACRELRVAAADALAAAAAALARARPVRAACVSSWRLCATATARRTSAAPRGRALAPEARGALRCVPYATRKRVGDALARARFAASRFRSSFNTYSGRIVGIATPPLRIWISAGYEISSSTSSTASRPRRGRPPP